MQKWIILAGTTCLALVADQASKVWVLANLAPYESVAPIPALQPLFQLTRSSNTGAAFGILPMAGDIFVIVAVFIIAGMLWYFRQVSPRERLIPFAFGLFIGGALGNVADRLQFGHVIDFIHYQIPHLISIYCNLADHAIVSGVLLFIGVYGWRDYREKRRLQIGGAAESAK